MLSYDVHTTVTKIKAALGNPTGSSRVSRVQLPICPCPITDEFKLWVVLVCVDKRWTKCWNAATPAVSIQEHVSIRSFTTEELPNFTVAYAAHFPTQYYLVYSCWLIKWWRMIAEGDHAVGIVVFCLKTVKDQTCKCLGSHFVAIKLVWLA
jgi:hypothetical protein